MSIYQNSHVPREFTVSSSSPHDAGGGRGPRRGAIQIIREEGASSPQPSPPSDGGEGALVAAWPRRVGGHASAQLRRTHSQLHQLKRKLLRVALEETPETELFKRLCGAANQAAELAWATSNPLLVYPSLFDEMVTAVRERFQQEQISDAQSSLTSLDADLRFEGIHSVSRGSDPISTGGGVSGRLTKTPTRGNRTAGQTARLPHIE